MWVPASGRQRDRGRPGAGRHPLRFVCAATRRAGSTPLQLPLHLPAWPPAWRPCPCSCLPAPVRLHAHADGKIAAYLEERVNVGVNFVLSAEVDHAKKDYKFGFGAPQLLCLLLREGARGAGRAAQAEHATWLGPLVWG